MSCRYDEWIGKRQASGYFSGWLTRHSQKEFLRGNRQVFFGVCQRFFERLTNGRRLSRSLTPNARIFSAPSPSAPDITATRARTCEEPKELETGTIPIGYAHHTVLSVADKVIEAVKSGAISRFVVMGGCDGRHKERQYFTDVALALPKDAIILTAGCAKYRYNKLGLGEIGGIPRVLDAGQCNDSYSLVVIAQALAGAFNCSINELPLSFDIAWYEQKL